MYFVVFDLGCSDCGESSNLVGLFTTEDIARKSLNQYIDENSLEGNDDHELIIYKIDTLDKIYNNSYTHIVFSSFTSNNKQ
ncbi:hypothetical protein PY093_14525 [Cytobacillus sp. S13-E01]|uniref:hypothetical protein n=1 Tax=Cytobacillus sp. S13-E01 TaxID=3031326 RepID=UPI0023D80E5B|nr:hypothetical protein [Cytobacillus sp. S13-E01]MDF0727889.1 hypothetical protein [Cytobacillus sp. S13-E01]